MIPYDFNFHLLKEPLEGTRFLDIPSVLRVDVGGGGGVHRQHQQKPPRQRHTTATTDLGNIAKDYIEGL